MSGFRSCCIPSTPTAPGCCRWTGGTVWPRTSIDGRPAVYATADAGASWRRLDRGLPRSQAWFTVLRQAMCTDAHPRTGVYFGTTARRTMGERAMAAQSWRCLVRHLPEIYSVTHAA